jgi:hypothetical protein
MEKTNPLVESGHSTMHSILRGRAAGSLARKKTDGFVCSWLHNRHYMLSLSRSLLPQSRRRLPVLISLQGLTTRRLPPRATHSTYDSDGNLQQTDINDDMCSCCPLSPFLLQKLLVQNGKRSLEFQGMRFSPCQRREPTRVSDSTIAALKTMERHSCRHLVGDNKATLIQVFPSFVSLVNDSLSKQSTLLYF